MLRLVRDTLRPILDGKAEYTIRRAACRALPLAHRSSVGLYVHACVWKTASQWIRLILSDPRVYRAGGHLPYIWTHARASEASLESIRRQERVGLTACFDPFHSFEAKLPGRPFSGIFVMRDPRDLLVSWYFSTRYTHSPTAGVQRHRKAMEGMSETEGLYYMTEQFAAEFPPIIESWLEAVEQGRPVLKVKFEEITGKNAVGEWKKVFDSFDIKLNEYEIQRILSTYSLDKLQIRSGRSGGNSEQKYNSGAQRKWQTYLNGNLYQNYQKSFQSLGKRMGYD